MNPLKFWKDPRPEQNTSGFFAVIVPLFYILAAVAAILLLASALKLEQSNVDGTSNPYRPAGYQAGNWRRL
jgi:hypothetical protein